MRLLGPPEVPGTARQEATVGAGVSVSLDVGAVRPQTADVPSSPMTTRKRPPSLPPPAGPEGPGGSELLLYTTPDNQTRIEVRLEDETVWLSPAQMADLFQTTKQNVSLHIRNLFEEGELDRAGTVKDSLTVQSEGGREVRRQIEVYNLDVIISVGYRVKSHRGTQFRIWATQRLREYLVKGFALDDDRLKDVRTLPGGRDYFDELLEPLNEEMGAGKWAPGESSPARVGPSRTLITRRNLNAEQTSPMLSTCSTSHGTQIQLSSRRSTERLHASV